MTLCRLSGSGSASTYSPRGRAVAAAAASASARAHSSAGLIENPLKQGNVSSLRYTEQGGKCLYEEPCWPRGAPAGGASGRVQWDGRAQEQARRATRGARCAGASQPNSITPSCPPYEAVDGVIITTGS